MGALLVCPSMTRSAAHVDGKPLSVGLGRGYGALSWPSVTVAGHAPPVHVGANHEEAEPQEGWVGHQGTKRDSVTGTDFRAARSLEDEQWRTPTHPRYRRARLLLPRLGRGVRNQQDERQEGMPAATSRRGCAEGMNP
jgi:hypothetical protein